MKISDKQIKAENRILRQLPEMACCFELGNYDVKILDIHFHLPDFKSSPWHSHSYFEAHLTFNGRGQIITYKGSRQFEAGSFCITSPNFEHCWNTEADDLYMYVISFELKIRPQCADRPSPIDMALSGLFEIEEFVGQSQDMRKLITNTISEISEAKCGLNYMLQCYMKQLIVSFARLVSAGRADLHEHTEELQKPLEDGMVMLINKYLADNYTSDIDLDMIARFVAKSKRSITRHYKNITGTTIIDKLLQMRLFLAEHLLTNSDKPIKTVAYEVGMPDVSYFCRQFKKCFGFAPSSYRELNPDKRNHLTPENLKKFDALVM